MRETCEYSGWPELLIFGAAKQKVDVDVSSFDAIKFSYWSDLEWYATGVYLPFDNTSRTLKPVSYMRFLR